MSLDKLQATYFFSDDKIFDVISTEAKRCGEISIHMRSG